MIRDVYLERSTFAPPPNRFEAGTPAITQAIGPAALLTHHASASTPTGQARPSTAPGALLPAHGSPLGSIHRGAAADQSPQRDRTAPPTRRPRRLPRQAPIAPRSGAPFDSIAPRVEPAPLVEPSGLGAAVDYLAALGMHNVQAYEEQLGAHLYRSMAEVGGLRLYGPDPAQGHALGSQESPRRSR